MTQTERPTRGDGPAFLLAQIGAHAAARFAERLGEIGLTPPLVGILRLLRMSAGQSQQALAEQLGVAPSRVVALVDDLEARGLLRRERSRTDRRVNVLQLTEEGTAALAAVRKVVEAHKSSLLAGIDRAEQATLTRLLQGIATQQGLTPGVHPGYRNTGAGPNQTRDPQAPVQTVAVATAQPRTVNP